MAEKNEQQTGAIEHGCRPMQEKWVYGYSPTPRGVGWHPIRQLSDEEYEAAGQAIRVVMDVLTGPTSFSELTRRDMIKTIEDVTARLSDDFRKIEEWGPEVEYRIVAVSAALRMHEEFVLATIRKRGDPVAESAARTLFSATYDKSVAYRVMYSLRNALVHGSKGLTTVTASGKLNEGNTLSTSVAISLNRAKFGGSDAKAAVRTEVTAMPEDPDLVTLASRALDDLADMRPHLEPLLYPDAVAATTLLFAYVKEVNSGGVGGPHFHAHDPGDPFGNMTTHGMNESVFNHVVQTAGSSGARR